MECACCSLSYVLIALLGLLGFGYLFVKKKYAYFQDRGILFSTPKFPLGSLTGAGTEQHAAMINLKIYNNFVGKDDICGMFFFVEPVVMVLEPELVKNVLVKDFNYFHDRGLYHNERDDPLSANLFALEGQKWKNLRTKLTPTFTSGKMKMMYSIVLRCAEEMETYLKPLAERSEMIEIKDVLGRFSTDVIGNCAFGIDCNSLKDPNAEFRVYGRKVFDPPGFTQLKTLFSIAFPSIAKKLGVVTTERTVSKFFLNVVRETLQHRKESPVVRNDFLKLLMEMESEDNSTGVDKLNFNEIAAQCYLFFLAGFETSSTTMSYCLFELAKNPDVQDKVREDIHKIIEKYDGQVTYDGIAEMEYLDRTINETLRKFPAVDSIIRSCTQDYKIPKSKHVIEKGTMVTIPVMGMQLNPDIYPDPEKFDPDRFLPENKATRHPFTFLPFGEGPHNCIGMRFGLMQTRLGLVHVLRNYKVVVCEKTAMKLEFSPSALILALKDGTWVRLEKL